MSQPLARPRHVGAVRVEGEGMLAGAEHQVAAHAGGEVEDHVGPGPADPLHRLAEEGRVAGAPPRLGVPDVDVDDGGAGPRRLDRGVRDLGRGDRNGGVLAHRVAGAGDRAGDEGVPVHRIGPRSSAPAAARERAARTEACTSIPEKINLARPRNRIPRRSREEERSATRPRAPRSGVNCRL